MRLKGIHYDTGFISVGGRLSRPCFDVEHVRREMEIIADDLHCTAVRISGGDPERIAIAAEAALKQRLEVWFSPFPTEQTPAELTSYFSSAAALAEELRGSTALVVFVLGCELTAFNRGFLPGANQLERLRALTNPSAIDGAELEALVRRFHTFVADAVSAVRRPFGGPVSYASGAWEPIDWTWFDIVGVDHYRDATNRGIYRDQLQPYFAHDRPVVVTEFGCATYRGADDRGALGWNIVDRCREPECLTEAVVRDEAVQAEYLREVAGLLAQTGVDGAFWFTFANFSNPHRAEPELDLDCASYGLVKMRESGTGHAYPGLPWEPKLAFSALSEAYASSSA